MKETVSCRYFSVKYCQILYISLTFYVSLILMISNKQTALFLKQLRKQYPKAFKRNYLFYSMIKTKGILDELKELIPWVLAAMIFISLSMSLSPYIASQFPQFNAFRSQGIAVLAIMLLFMLYTPAIKPVPFRHHL